MKNLSTIVNHNPDTRRVALWYRLIELSRLKTGWNRGEGDKFDPRDLSKFADIFLEHFNPESPFPDIKPMIDRGIRLEWVINNWDCSIEFYFKCEKIFFHAFSFNDWAEFKAEGTQTDKALWRQINSFLQKLDKIQGGKNGKPKNNH